MKKWLQSQLNAKILHGFQSHVRQLNINHLIKLKSKIFNGFKAMK